MTKYTFSLNNNNSTFYTPKYNNTDYSKILDDLINADIKEKNGWLNGYTSDGSNNTTIKIKLNNTYIPTYTYNEDDDIITTACKTLEYEDNLKKAFKFFANYNLNSCPFKTNTLYKIGDDIKFMILIDGILINDKMFFFDDFNNLSFLNNLSSKMKKTIATIYIDGLKITIKK